MMEIKLKNEQGDTLETIKINHVERFILYRGFLFERTVSDVTKPEYVQRQYIEIS